MATIDKPKSQTGRELLSGLKVVDTDTHITEWHDLWTSRASPKYRDLVPRVVKNDEGTASTISASMRFTPAPTT
jgi:hypothetical protein